MKRCLLILLLAVTAWGQTHTFPALDTNNTFTGTNAFQAITATSATISGLTSGRCVQTTSGGLLTVASGVCSAPITLQVNGTPNGNQNLLNLIPGSGTTIVDNGSGGITISAPAQITLKTNGSNNTSQSILNLKNGANMTLTSDGAGGVTFNSTPPNGLSYAIGHYVTIVTDANSTVATIGGPGAQVLGTAANVAPTATVAGHRSYTSAASGSVNISAGAEVNAGAGAGNSAYAFGSTAWYAGSIRLNNTANARYWIGMADVGTSDMTGPSAVFASDTPNRNYCMFRYSSTTDTTLKAVCATSNAAQTVVDTGIAPDTTLPQLFQINNRTSAVDFYINGTLVATVSSNIPAGATRIVPFWCSDNKNTATAVGAGFFYMTLAFVN